MSKTNDLEGLVQSLISTHIRCAQLSAPSEWEYPYAVWALADVDLGDLSRDDTILEVSIWFMVSPENQAQANNTADELEKRLNAANLPQETILPTFFRISRQTLEDEDKTLRRILLRFQIQNYERK